MSALYARGMGMKKTMKDLFRQLLPLSKKHKKDVEEFSWALSEDQLRDVKYLLKTKKIGVVDTPLNISKSLSSIQSVPQFSALVDHRPVRRLIEDFNNIIRTEFLKKSYEDFAPHVRNKLFAFIAPNILGLETVKTASMLQLFSKERFHLLLLGDPGTGKTDVLRSTSELSPVSAFGLGSGTTGAGLSVSYKGNEMKKGLLPKADGGICAIDELNLMRNKDAASLYSAMEKGFITYDKAGKHQKIDANVRIVATANPKGDRFVGKSLSILKDQLPFGTSLLSRFHLAFVIRTPDVEKTVSIAKQIAKDDIPQKRRKEDIGFIRGYVEYALKRDVTFDKKLEPMVTSFIEEAKKNEDKYIVEVGPRLVHGIMRIAQAYARSELRSKTSQDDVVNALGIVKRSFAIEGIVRS